MQSKATTVAKYLAELSAERRQAIEVVRKMILANLDPEYVEQMSYGMIGYSVPLSLYPNGYHANPTTGLPFASLASQKNHMSLYLMGLYCGCTPGEPTHQAAVANSRWFHEAWAKTGKKLDMGKACIRFKRVEDLALDVLAEAIRRVPARRYIEIYETAMAERLPAGKSPSKKAIPKKAPKKVAKKSVPPAAETSKQNATKRVPAKRKKAQRDR